jgi:hypothetical protein
MAIPLKYAAILWDDKTGQVIAVDIRNPEDMEKHKKFPLSGGACWVKWRKANPEDLITYMSELQLELLFNYGICVETLEILHKQIEEYKDEPIIRNSYMT